MQFFHLRAISFSYETDKIQENYSKLARYENLVRYKKLNLSIFLEYS